MRRTTTAFSSLCVVAGLLVASPAFARGAPVNACTWDGGTRTATIAMDALGPVEGMQFGRVPGTKRIGYVTEGPTWTECANATVTSTDEVVVTGSDRHDYVVLSLEGGRLGPGHTTEAKGVSEIEVSIDLGAGTDTAVLLGSDGDDALALPSQTKGSYNDDADVDVTFVSVWQHILDGGAGHDLLDGSGARADIRGGDGDDKLYGGPYDDDLCGDCGLGADGSDVVKGGDGNDEINGDGKADTLYGGNGRDYLYGSTGDDTAYGEGGGDIFPGGSTVEGSDTLAGGAGEDTVSYEDRSVGVSITQDGSKNDGAPAEGDNVVGDIERLIGTPMDDTLVGSLLDQKIEGLAGDDLVNGGGGDDTLPDQEGYDTYRGGAGDDQLVSELSGGYDDTYLGGAGTDTVDFSSRSTPMDIDVTTPDGDGVTDESDDVGSDIEVIVGGSAGDLIIGGIGVNKLYGSGGADELYGGGGPDVLYGGDDADSLDGGEGYDELYGEAGIDVMYSEDLASDYVDCGSVPDDGTLGSYDIGLDYFDSCVLPF